MRGLTCVVQAESARRMRSEPCGHDCWPDDRSSVKSSHWHARASARRTAPRWASVRYDKPILAVEGHRPRAPQGPGARRLKRVRCLSCPLSSTAGTAETFPTRFSVKLVVDRAEERAGPEDVGDQALMRGLVTAFPFVRPGLSLPGVGRRSCDRPRRQLGSSPCRGPALAAARLMFDYQSVAT